MGKKIRLTAWGLVGLGILALGFRSSLVHRPVPIPLSPLTKPAIATRRAEIIPLGAPETQAYFSRSYRSTAPSPATWSDSEGAENVVASEIAQYYRRTPDLSGGEKSIIYRLGATTSASRAARGAPVSSRALDAEELQFLNSSLSSLLHHSSGKSAGSLEENDDENPFNKLLQKENMDKESMAADHPASGPPAPPAEESAHQDSADVRPKGVNAGPVLRFFGAPERDGVVRAIEAHALGPDRFGLARYGVGTFNFTIQPNYLASPLSITMGDVNNDGIADLIVADRLRNNITVLLGVGDNIYQEAEHFQVGYSVMAMAVGDVNGDNNLDLIVASKAHDNISILLGNGQGQFDYVGSFAGLPHPTAILVQDINGDRTPDIILLDLSQQAVMAFVGDGRGQFTEADAPALTVEVQSIPTPDWYAGTRVTAIEFIRFADNVSLNANYGGGAIESIINYVNAPNRFIGLGSFSGNGQIDMAVGTLLDLARE